jgi:endonuclease/exonuclease/phosphatase family metal-dependent hydrolase
MASVGAMMEASWIENLCKYRTLVELKRSAFFLQCGDQIRQFLKTPQIWRHPEAAPRLNSFLRVMQWNIEKGKRFDAILNLLQTSEILQWADVLILNESDRGMNRSENRHVALDIAGCLGMNMVFGPAYIELTKGTGEERTLKGENRESLQGNAILSRYPILDASIIQLPNSFEAYEFTEKRFGWRNCLWARLELRNGPLWVGAVHLELRNTPKSRARQMLHVMNHLPGDGLESCLLGGDLNTNSFSRGGTWRTLHSVFRILMASPSAMKHQLLHPETGREPLFGVLNRHGFCWQNFNSSDETARAAIDSLEEADYIPSGLLNAMQRRLDPYEGYLIFKLDWLMGKNVKALTGGERRDFQTEVISLEPGCINGENAGSRRISDHLPIYADLDMA